MKIDTKLQVGKILKDFEKNFKGQEIKVGIFASSGVHSNGGEQDYVCNYAYLQHEGGYIGKKQVKRKGKIYNLPTSIPSRPFLKKTYEKNAGKWKDEIGKSLKSDLDLEKALIDLGYIAVNDIKEEILNTNEPPNSPLTIAAKKSSKPLIDTGRMINSVEFKFVEND